MSRFLKIMVALLAITAFAAPAIAADGFSVYGSARTSTFYADKDVADTSQFKMDLLATSRLGMKASKGAVSGQYEVGIGKGAALGDDVYTRLIYGTYTFDSGSFSVGQMYTAFGVQGFLAVAADGDAGLSNWGFMGYTGRQVALKYALNSGFSFYAVENKTEATTDDFVMPKLEVAYDGKAGDFSYHFALGYQDTQLTADDSIAAYVTTFTGKLPVGPAALKFSLSYGQNANNYGVAKTKVPGTAAEDSTFFAGAVQATFKANDSNSINIGMAYASEDRDDLADAEVRTALFISDVITLAPGFMVIPEITYFELNDQASGDADDEQLYVGAKWQINF